MYVNHFSTQLEKVRTSFQTQELISIGLLFSECYLITFVYCWGEKHTQLLGKPNNLFNWIRLWEEFF